MKWQLPKNSLFAILLRSPWWISLALGAAVFLGLRPFFKEALALFGALPFVVVSALALRKQLRLPRAGKVAAVLERHRAMSAEGFTGALEEAFRRQGHGARRLSGREAARADLEVTMAGRVMLVSCKRWKAVRTGIEPLRELHAAVRAAQAGGGIYVAAGEVTENAKAFAGQSNIRLLQDMELARLLEG